MKKITDLQARMLDMGGKNDKPDDMPTRREILTVFGNFKADSADDARRTRRIISRLRDRGVAELVLENEDMAFLNRVFEKNIMTLPAWMQGQVLELIDGAEKVETAEKK